LLQPPQILSVEVLLEAFFCLAVSSQDTFWLSFLPEFCRVCKVIDILGAAAIGNLLEPQL
jgi:hypothetical protein